jgi:hypothetical protein
MTDNELRGIILAWFYEHRREGSIVPIPLGGASGALIGLLK